MKRQQPLRRGARWALIAAGALCVIVVALLIFAPPFVARRVLQNKLQSYGIRAQIDNVDVDILDGRISLDDAHGKGPRGDPFTIGHLGVNVDYGALFDKHIRLDRLKLADANLSVRRTADHGLRILGFPLPGQSSKQTSGWGFGIDQAALANVTLHYREAGEGNRRPIRQSITITQAKVGHFATWQPGQSTPLTIHLAVGDGHLALDGRMTPLAAGRTAHFKLDAGQFPMPALAPLARMAGVRDLAGTFDANQQIDFRYRADQGLDFGLKGHSTWHNARAATADGTDFKGRNMAWQGQARINLWRGESRPGTVAAQGRLTLASINLRRSGQFDFAQGSAQWQGKAHATFAAQTTQFTTRGDLSASNTRFDSPGSITLSSAKESLHGGLDLTLAADRSTFASEGRFKAQSMSLAVPGSMRLESSALNWNGKTTTALAGDGAHIRTDGGLVGDHMVFDVPQTAHVTARHVDWKGKTQMHSAASFARTFDGRLIAESPYVDIRDTPLDLTADRFTFDGHYAARPTGSSKRLRLRISGDAYGQNVAANDTAIKAPWMRALQIDATDLDVDGLDAIRVGSIEAAGLRVLGDTDTDSAVLRAVSMKARQFSLTDLAHYALHDVTIGDADIHTRHDASGAGVISQFMNSAAGRTSAGSGDKKTASNKANSTFAVDHLHLSGPAIAFVDTTTTPSVHVTGHNLDFTLDNLNSAKPEQSATFKLALDVGAYGHLDSLGKIAPLAPGGPDMDINVWLRSLALAPLSGYLNEAMGRQIANGVADGTLDLKATQGNLNGTLDMKIANFRLANNATRNTDIVYGISMSTALKLIRGQDDLLHFRTRILGDVTQPYFSIDNLIREAVLAGLRTALFSNYSPVGLLNKARNAFLNLFRSVEDYPVIFRPGAHYVQPGYRKYMVLLAKAMRAHPAWTLHIVGQAVPADVKKLKLAKISPAARRARLKQLAHERQSAIKDYLTARSVNPARIVGGDPKVRQDPDAQPTVTFSLDK